MQTNNTLDKLEGFELTDDELENVAGGLTNDEIESVASNARTFKQWNMTRETAAEYARAKIGRLYSDWTEEQVVYMIDHWDEF